MQLQPTIASRLLSASVGYEAIASDGQLGVVETPLFPPDASEPDFLVLRVRGRLRTRHPIVPVSLVAGVDAERRLVRLRGTRAEIELLPEQLPLAL